MKARVEEPEAANEGKDEVEESEEEEEEERKFLEGSRVSTPQLFVAPGRGMEKKIIRHMVWKWIFSFLVCFFFWMEPGPPEVKGTTVVGPPEKKNQTYQTHPNTKETSGTV